MGLEALTAYIKEGRKSSPKEFRVSNDGIQRLKKYSQYAREYDDKLRDINSKMNPKNPFNRKVLQDMTTAMLTRNRFRALSNELEQGKKVDLTPSNYGRKGKKLRLMLQPLNMQFGDIAEVADELLGLIYPKDEAGHEHLESEQIRQALRRGKTIRLVPPQK